MLLMFFLHAREFNGEGRNLFRLKGETEETALGLVTDNVQPSGFGRVFKYVLYTCVSLVVLAIAALIALTLYRFGRFHRTITKRWQG